jgi:hypothetical protein
VDVTLWIIGLAFVLSWSLLWQTCRLWSAQADLKTVRQARRADTATIAALGRAALDLHADLANAHAENEALGGHRRADELEVKLRQALLERDKFRTVAENQAAAIDLSREIIREALEPVKKT